MKERFQLPPNTIDHATVYTNYICLIFAESKMLLKFYFNDINFFGIQSYIKV